MKKKIPTFFILMLFITVSASANDFIIKDSQGQPLFTVDSSGEKQIQNGNLYLNGNQITDQEGYLTLAGKVQILNGNLDFNSSSFSLQSSGGSVFSYNDTSNTKVSTPSGTGTVAKFYDSTNNQDILRAREEGDVEIPNGNLNLEGNKIENVEELKLSWSNLTNYPVGCGSEEAVRVIGDTLDCISLNPGGTVETGGGSIGEVAFFVDYDNVTGSDNFYWNNSETRLGIGTNDPEARLDINGKTNLRNTLLMNDEDITNPDLVNGVDLDNPGNGISIGESGSYVIDSNAIEGGYIAEDAIGNREMDNSANFTVSDLTTTGDIQVRGNLDVWGQVSNTDVQNLNVNGSIYPPDGYSDTFDIGSSNRKWRNVYIGSNIELDGTSFTESNLDALEDGVIQNSELENSDITVNANSGLSGGGTPALGGTVDLSHAETSTVSQTNDLSNGTVIQDFNFDTYGHTTSITTKNLDNRYYTETETNSNFVNSNGDTMTGNLDLDQSNLYLDESASNPWTVTGSSNFVISRDSTGGAEVVYRSSSDTLEIGSNDGGASLKLNGQLNMNGNSINSYFDSDGCASGEVVEDILDNGTYECISITGSAADEFVNDDGDSMTGDLDMQGNDLQNVGTMNASLIQESGSDIGGLYVDESGDSMSGSLNLQNHHIDNVNYLEMNSEGNIRTDGTNAVNIDGNQNVEVSNGNLGVGSDTSERFVITPTTSSGDADAFQKIEYRDTGEAGIKFYDGEAQTWRMESGDAYGGSLSFQNERTGGNVLLDLETDNTIGVGTSEPDSLMDVAGDLTVDGNVNFAQDGNIQSSGMNVVTLDGNQNVEIPNGGLNVNNQLSVGSTECKTGEYIDGDGTCTSVTGSTSDVYVEESGDTMTGDLDINGNKLQNVGSGNIDFDPNGAGNINMRSEEIQNAAIVHSEDMIVGSYSTGTSKVNGNDLYVQDDVEVGGDIVGSGADVAENIENESEMKPGTVVKISGNMSIDRTEEAHDTEVAGVVSSDPAMIMAEDRGGVPVAMTGTVPVKVTMENGEITPGDMLTTSSTPGKAMKCLDQDRCEGSTIGKAMEPAETPGKIRMLVSMG